MKICPVGVELFHEESWTDMTMLTVAIYCFAIVPKEYTTVTCGTRILMTNDRMQYYCKKDRG
jgi:hypothetical protein